MLYLFPLLKPFKLDVKFINIQQDTLTITDLTSVEQILKRIRPCFKVLEYGIHYRSTSKKPRLLLACDQAIFKGKTECNLNTLTTHNYRLWAKEGRGSRFTCLTGLFSLQLMVKNWHACRNSEALKTYWKLLKLLHNYGKYLTGKRCSNK